MSEDHNDPGWLERYPVARVACECGLPVRPTKRRHRPALILCRATWRALTALIGHRSQSDA
jgi:hypothetical protein